MCTYCNKMALKSESGYVNDSLGIKVEGELGDFQIIEEKSDSDDDDRTDSKSSRTIDTLATIPSSVVKPSSSPIGNVAVSNSENVIIGNNTYFNGPVVIKQVIQNTAGLENPSYVKTEDENVPVQKYQEESKNDSAIKKFHLRRWHKITFSAVCIVILGGIFAILSIILSHSTQDDTPQSSPSMSEEDSTTGKSNYSKVVGLLYENLNLIIFTIVLTTLTFLLMFYTLLTLDGSGGEKSVVTDTAKSKKKRDYEAILDDYDPYMNTIKKDNPLLIAPDHLRIVPRADWLAQPVENSLDKIRQPVPWVIISHTATESCTMQSECVLRVRLIQMFHIESRKWDDIGYNFLVAGDGSAYFGRGWDYVGAHTLGYNRYSIGISFIGTFNNDPPPKNQIDACLKLLKRGVETGKLAKDYKLFAHRQLASTLSPGDKLYDIIKEWPHFVRNFTDPAELLPKYD